MADLKSFINTSSDRIKSAMGVPVDRIKTIQGSVLKLFADFTVIGKNRFNKATVLANTLLYSTGNISAPVDPTSSTSDFISIDEGQRVIALSGLTAHTGAAPYICWYDANKTYIGYTSHPSTDTQFIFVVPITARFIRFSITRAKTSGETIDLNTIQVEYQQITPFEAFSSTVQNLEIAPDLLPKYVTTLGKNRFSTSLYSPGVEVTSTGAVGIYATSAITGYILIPTDARFIYLSGLTAYATGVDRYLCFYDSARTFISYSPLARTSVSGSISIPSNAVYVIVSLYGRKTSGETIDLSATQIEFYGETEYAAYDTTPRDRTKYPLHDVNTWGKTLLAAGDSIMETCLNWTTDGATYTEGGRENWLSFATGLLKIGKLRNYAAAGGGWIDVSQSTRLKIQTQVATAIANNATADIFVINAGVNDGHPVTTNLGDFATAMGKATLNDLDKTNLYEALRWNMWSIRNAYPTAKCFVGNVLPNSNYANSVYLNTNTAIELMAAEYDFIYVDQYADAGFVAATDTSDGLHPNHAGSKKLATYWQGIITAQF